MQPDHPFGAWLRQQRKALDLTQAELAQRVGCAPVTMKKIEAGVRRPSKQIAERLAAVLAIQPPLQAAFVAFARGLSAVPPTMASPGAGPVHHVPSQPTAFVGRSRELAYLQRLLDAPDSRLMTIVGPGGSGKTRLAVEAAHRNRTSFAHGAHFVSLAAVTSADAWLFAIADVLEYSLVGHEAPAVQLAASLRDKTVLLLLDNVEHVLDGVPVLVDLLAGAPHLKLLITSRERLNLHGEWVLPLDGLDYPLTADADDDHLASYSAVQLFVQSAQRVQPDFALQGMAPDVLRICQQVEGMPLALELAAAWVRLLPCSHIAEQLAASLDFLASPLRDVPERHRSLRAVFDQAWNVLSPPEQAALARLSVFRGPFDLEAAREIGGASLPVLASLADKSLLQVSGPGWYALHELLRRYAAAHLLYQGVEAGHAERAIDYLSQAAQRAGRAAAQRQAAGLLGQAVAIAEEAGLSDLASSLHHKRGQALLEACLWVEARPAFAAALAAAGLEQLDRQVQLLLASAEVDFYLHDVAAQRHHVSEALRQAEEAQRADLVVAAMVKLGDVETNVGHLTEAVSRYERALAGGGDAHHHLGRTYYWLGRYPEALTSLRAAVAVRQGQPLKQIFPLQDLGLALVATGQYTEAVRAFGEAQHLSREHEVWPLLARAVANLAGLHLEVFDYAGHEALAEEARALARSADFVLAEVSAGLDLLFNYARRNEVGRAAHLLADVAATVEKAHGSHGWLWRLRLAQARAELALAQQEWEETLRLADLAMQHSRQAGRVKYLALALKTRAQALVARGHSREALSDLRKALDLTGPTSDPGVFLQIAASLLAVEGDDALAREAYAVVQRLSAALPDDEMRQSFAAAEPVRQLVRWMG
ncbi:MAG TPA: helix-turn-helix domain-containing protein [Ktedonobacteraceae bacterium]|nr:helix-turn-helix domain-containing protein [Ktedonobacteraceae bacterium]